MKKEEKEQLEGEKRNEDNRQSEEKEERRRRAAREKFPTWRGIQISSLNISSRPGGGDTAPIRLLSLHSGGVCRSCYFLL